MKRQGIKLVLALSVLLVFSGQLSTQVLLINETFDGMTTGDTTLPTGWTQINEGTFDLCSGTIPCYNWYSDNNGTPSNNTGPSADHTGLGQEYVYVEASSNANDSVIMESPAFDLAGSPGELRFWVYNYNGNGSTTNHQIHIDVVDAATSAKLGVAILTVSEQFVSTAWSERVVDLSAYSGSGNIKIRFRWDLGDINDWRCDMSIDDVTVTQFDSDLNSCWAFDGNANDFTGTNNGTTSGSPAYSLGVFDDGIDLDGVDDQVSISHSGDLAPVEFTAMLWVETPATFASGQQVIFENDRSGSDWYALYKSSTVDQFRFKMGTSEADIPTTLVTNTWYHVAITYSSGTAEYFINGTSQGTMTGLSDLTGSAATLTLGNNSASEAYEGILDEFKIIDTILTSSEINSQLALSCGLDDIGEICFNGIDDDNDGMIDDVDPDCCDPLGTGEAFFPAGDAAALGDNSFRITADLNNEAGAAWYKARANLAFDFQFAFQINLGSRNADGADGLAFVLHNDSRGYAAFGGAGIGLGYAEDPTGTHTESPIEPSIAIEFDTWENLELSTISQDIPDDHSAITHSGQLDNVINTEGVVCLDSGCANVEDGADHAVVINWDASLQTLSMSFDGSQRVSYTGDIVNQYLNGTPTVFFGFTGSTGGATNLQTFDIDSIEIVLVEICGNGVDDDCNGLIDENDSWCKNRCGNIVNANISATGDTGLNEAPLGWSTGNPTTLASTTSGTGIVNLGAVNLDDADDLTVISGEVLNYNTGPGTIFSVPNVNGTAQFMMGQETDGILQVVDGLTIGADYRFTFDAAYTWLSGATEPTEAILHLLLDPPDAVLDDDTPVDSHSFSASNTIETIVLEFTATSTQHEVIIYAENLPTDYVWFLELGSGNCGIQHDIVTNMFIPNKIKNN